MGASAGTPSPPSALGHAEGRLRRLSLHRELSQDTGTRLPSTFLHRRVWTASSFFKGRSGAFRGASSLLIPAPKYPSGRSPVTFRRAGRRHLAATRPPLPPGRKLAFPLKIPALLSPAHQPPRLAGPPPPAGPRGRASHGSSHRSWQPAPRAGSWSMRSSAITPPRPPGIPLSGF